MTVFLSLECARGGLSDATPSSPSLCHPIRRPHVPRRVRRERWWWWRHSAGRDANNRDIRRKSGERPALHKPSLEPGRRLYRQWGPVSLYPWRYGDLRSRWAHHRHRSTLWPARDRGLGLRRHEHGRRPGEEPVAVAVDTRRDSYRSESHSATRHDSGESAE